MPESQDTVIGGLKKLFPTVSQLLLAPDANQHKQFIDGLMNGIRAYISAQAQSTVGGGGQGAPGGAPNGSPPPGQPQPSPQPGAALPAMANAPGGGGGMSGLMGAASQNPDELRRLLTSTTNP